MHRYLKAHPWKIIEESFDPALHLNSESLFSIGNGRLGQRANFEEKYSGESLQGTYVAGVYYPDKTRVGWWKNGYPEYFAKVLNAIQWHHISVHVNGSEVDLAKSTILSFYRELDMKNGRLSKKIKLETIAGHIIEISSQRFYSISNQDAAFASYHVKAVNGPMLISLVSSLESDIRNNDANYNDDFWHEREGGKHYLKSVTKKTNFTVAAACKHIVQVNGNKINPIETLSKENRYQETYSASLDTLGSIHLNKFVSITSSRYLKSDQVIPKALQIITQTCDDGYDAALKSHAEAWANRWKQSDIIIEGDVEAQQGIRFNIYQLYQTYDGSDNRLNIGPKGFTGEKYGGSTYWDTEAYCMPFYMSTTSANVARNLLIYRHQHLNKAIENAQKLGFTNGAALYPMVTMNGEECHNEWEITFEEIHRNGAIAFAIFDYVRYTGDKAYLADYGMEVLIAISRFWSQRVHWSSHRDQYVMLGVTGPNEYENNVDNNWYTNYIAKWCLTYTLSSLAELKDQHPKRHQKLSSDLHLTSDKDQEAWQHIVDNMYLPQDQEKGIFLQQDGYLDKEDITVADLSSNDRPINQKWSWDRILRSPFIKQADVLQGLYFFEDDFDLATHRNNFLYYEPKTVHESSLSPCVHSILAAKLGMKEKAYEMYLRTARLDLDDYNNDTEDGCHITSMAGTWLSIVEGFAGMRAGKDHLKFRPFLPEQWIRYSFKIIYRGQQLLITTDKEGTTIYNHGKESVFIDLMGVVKELTSGTSIIHPLQ